MSDALDTLLDEARAELGTREVTALDWDAVDAKLFARLDQHCGAERAAELGRLAPGQRRRLTAVAAAFAVAAALIAVFVGKAGDSLNRATAASDGAGTVVAVDGDGRTGSLLVDGKPALRGTELRLGDVLETRDASATIDRPGKLTMTLEPGSRTVVTHVHGSLVMALLRGAIEAQVVPVAVGEAFAVDVDGTRVAVHGTHLRVAREGDRVTVDLNEGVVAIGEAPREGSVVGTVVTAPAHVEFEASDAATTLTQTHDPVSVRPPAPSLAGAVLESPFGAPALETSARRPPLASVDDSRTEGHSSPGVPMTARPSIAAAKAGRPAEEVIAQAVQSCMERRPHTGNVTLVVSTTLHLEIGEDGMVQSARFDPPVAPNVNTCAAQTIYRERFDRRGSAAIAIDFTN